MEQWSDPDPGSEIRDKQTKFVNSLYTKIGRIRDPVLFYPPDPGSGIKHPGSATLVLTVALHLTMKTLCVINNKPHFDYFRSLRDLSIFNSDPEPVKKGRIYSLRLLYQISFLYS
jgi:hypothetical protein